MVSRYRESNIWIARVICDGCSMRRVRAPALLGPDHFLETIGILSEIVQQAGAFCCSVKIGIVRACLPGQFGGENSDIPQVLG